MQRGVFGTPFRGGEKGLERKKAAGNPRGKTTSFRTNRKLWLGGREVKKTSSRVCGEKVVWGGGETTDKDPREEGTKIEGERV